MSNLIRYINHFGAQGGFQKILERLEKPLWCPIEIVQNYLEGFSNIHVFYYRDFVKEFIPKLWNSIF